MTDESVVVDDGQTYVSEETAEIAKQAMNQAKQWAEESERQANLATGAADDAIDAKNYAQAAITDENLIMVANDLNSPSGKINTVVNNMSDINTVVDNIEDIQDAYDNALKAKDWAIKMDGTVDGVEYSAKYYADLAGQNAGALSGANKDLSNLTPTGNDKFVTKDTSQTISGVKTFQGTGYITQIKNTSVTYNTAPASNSFTTIAFVDKNNIGMGVVEVLRETDNTTTALLNAYGANGAWSAQPLRLNVASNGTTTAYAPPPTDTTSTSSHQIATVGWVNSANNNVVHRTGDETISGYKYFTANLIRAHTDLTKGTNPSSPLYWGVEFTDKNGPITANRLGLLETVLHTNGDVETYIAAYLNTNGSRDQTALKIVYTKSGNKYAIAPASDVIDSIVTTKAIHKASGKGSFKFGNGMIVNYGAQQMTKDSTTVITFDTPFTGDYTYGLSTGYKSSISRDDPITIPNRTSTNFTARNTARDSDAVTCIWVAVGY